MILTSPGMSSRYPGALLQTRINNLIEIANQAYINSNIAISLRVVRQQQVAYGDTQTLDQALNDLTNGAGSLATVGSLRTQYGADLVTLLRPYDGSVDSGCGMAWVLDYVNTPASFSRAHAMSVVSDGDDCSRPRRTIVRTPRWRMRSATTWAAPTTAHTAVQREPTRIRTATASTTSSARS